MLIYGGDDVAEITKEEEVVMNASLYFPIAISVLEKELNRFSESELTLKYVYKQLLEKKISELRSDMIWARKKMFKLGMKMEKGKSDEMIVPYNLYIRGRVIEFRFWMSAIKNRTYEVIDIYFGVEGQKGAPKDCEVWIKRLKEERRKDN